MVSNDTKFGTIILYNILLFYILYNILIIQNIILKYSKYNFNKLLKKNNFNIVFKIILIIFKGVKNNFNNI